MIENKQTNVTFRVAGDTLKSFVLRGEFAFLRGWVDEMTGCPIFDGRLYIEPEHLEPTEIRNFPVGPPPVGWSTRASGAGYELVHDESQEVILGFRVDSGVCRVTTDLYDADGPLALLQDGELTISGGELTVEKLGTDD